MAHIVFSTTTTATTSLSNRFSELHQNLMRFIAQMAGVNLGAGTVRQGGGGGGGGGAASNVDRLLRAIAKGETQTVRTLCQENSGLVSTYSSGLLFTEHFFCG